MDFSNTKRFEYPKWISKGLNIKGKEYLFWFCETYFDNVAKCQEFVDAVARKKFGKKIRNLQTWLEYPYSQIQNYSEFIPMIHTLEDIWTRFPFDKVKKRDINSLCQCIIITKGLCAIHLFVEDYQKADKAFLKLFILLKKASSKVNYKDIFDFLWLEPNISRHVRWLSSATLEVVFQLIQKIENNLTKENPGLEFGLLLNVKALVLMQLNPQMYVVDAYKQCFEGSKEFWKVHRRNENLWLMITRTVKNRKLKVNKSDKSRNVYEWIFQNWPGYKIPQDILLTWLERDLKEGNDFEEVYKCLTCEFFPRYSKDICSTANKNMDKLDSLHNVLHALKLLHMCSKKDVEFKDQFEEPSKQNEMEKLSSLERFLDKVEESDVDKHRLLGITCSFAILALMCSIYKNTQKNPDFFVKTLLKIKKWCLICEVSIDYISDLMELVVEINGRPIDNYLIKEEYEDHELNQRLQLRYYFEQKYYDEIIDYAKKASNSGGPLHFANYITIQAMIGLSYFHKQDYSQAMEWFQFTHDEFKKNLCLTDDPDDTRHRRHHCGINVPSYIQQIWLRRGEVDKLTDSWAHKLAIIDWKAYHGNTSSNRVNITVNYNCNGEITGLNSEEDENSMSTLLDQAQLAILKKDYDCGRTLLMKILRSISDIVKSVHQLYQEKNAGLNGWSLVGKAYAEPIILLLPILTKNHNFFHVKNLISSTFFTTSLLLEAINEVFQEENIFDLLIKSFTDRFVHEPLMKNEKTDLEIFRNSTFLNKAIKNKRREV